MLPPRDIARAAGEALLHAAASCALVLASLLPPPVAYLLAAGAGDILYAVSRRRRRIALRNLDIAFRGELTRGEKRRIARRSFRHAMAHLSGMALRGRWAREGSLERLFAISAEEDRLLRAPSARGVAFLGGHVGDWEMTQHYLGLRGIPVAVVTRAVSSPGLDRVIVRLRSERGGRVIAKRGALRDVRATLRGGGAVGILADQNCPRRERFFEFFGVPASTYTEHASVLARSGCRILFVACVREGFRFRFRVHVRDLASDLPAFPGVTERERRRLRADEVVKRYLAALEELIRRNPEQHFWMHRRWKSRPTGTPWLYHDLGKPLEPSLLG